MGAKKSKVQVPAMLALTIMLSASLVLLLSIASWKLVYSLRTMEVYMGAGVMLTRSNNPHLFFAIIVVQFLVAGGLLAAILWSILVFPNLTLS